MHVREDAGLTWQPLITGLAVEGLGGARMVQRIDRAHWVENDPDLSRRFGRTGTTSVETPWRGVLKIG